MHHRPIEAQLAGRQRFDDELAIEGGIARHAGLPAQAQPHRGAHPRGRGLAHRLGIIEEAQRRILRVGGHQRAQHARGVGVAARAGIVLRVGDDHRARGAGCQGLRAAHGLGGFQEVRRPFRLQLQHAGM
ncbi:hypothetical protein D3C85_861340 [compost metagenome]